MLLDTFHQSIRDAMASSQKRASKQLKSLGISVEEVPLMASHQVSKGIIKYRVTGPLRSIYVVASLNALNGFMSSTNQGIQEYIDHRLSVAVAAVTGRAFDFNPEKREKPASDGPKPEPSVSNKPSEPQKTEEAAGQPGSSWSGIVLPVPNDDE